MLQFYYDFAKRWLMIFLMLALCAVPRLLLLLLLAASAAFLLPSQPIWRQFGGQCY
jgi:hypothetical protein